MNRCRALWVSGLSLAMLATTARAADLGVGDKAPPLKISKWVKGDQVDPTKGGSKDVYVVEFWATWCGPCRTSIPHLSELYDHFKSKNVHFVGISDEKASVVKEFLDDGWDSKMRYTVAIDDDGETNKTWMKAAGKNGIPCAFIVMDGTIKWIGHPMAGMDAQIAELAGDKEFLKTAKELEEAGKALMKAAGDEDWKGAVAAADRILKIRPTDPQANMAKFHILAVKIKDTQAATKAGYDLVKSATEPQLLNQLAWGMLTDKTFRDIKDIKLATAAAKKAVELTKSKDGAILDTYARAIWEAGDHPEAIKIQKQAIEVTKDKRMKKQLQATLTSYEKGKTPSDDEEDVDDEESDEDSDD